MASEWLGTKHWSVVCLFPDKSLPLHAMITSCGHEIRKSPEYHLDGLKRGNSEFSIWQHTLAGEGTLEIEGEVRKLHAGDSMFLHIPQNHKYCLAPDAKEPWEFVFVSLQGREIMRLWRELELKTGGVARLREGSPALEAASEILRFYQNGLAGSHFNASAMAYKMTMALCEELLPYGSPKDELRMLLRKMSDFCQARLSEEITVDSMAQAAGYSKFHFSRLFHESCGMPPASFLRDLRMKTAVRLLQMERLTVKEIASKCGFPDESYFCKVFKKAYGSSPEAFRHGDEGR